MKTAEQIHKINAVVLYVLQSFKEGVDYIKLFKIIYFAQKEYLAKYGRPIIEDTFRARAKGPVPSLTYKVIKEVEYGESPNSDLSEFASSLSVTDNQIVFPACAPDTDWIADMERKVIDETIQKYKDMGSSKLSEISHDEAYMKARKSMDEDPEKDIISHIDIARAGGASQRMLEYIKECEILKRALD